MNSKTDDLFETPAYMLRRNKDPVTSHEAAELVNTPKMERIVYNAISEYGADGCISDDVVRTLSSYDLVSISPRFKPLESKGLIYRKGDKKRGVKGRNQLIMRADRRSEKRVL